MTLDDSPAPIATAGAATAGAATAGAATFEQAYRELRAVIGQIEEGGLSLDAALQLYERGFELVARCEHIVDAAELRVLRLAPDSLVSREDSAPDGAG